MIVGLWDFFHSIGFHFYTIPAFIVILASVIVGIVHRRNEKKREDDHQDRLDEIYENRAFEKGGSI